jgi:5'-nucleotidase
VLSIVGTNDLHGNLGRLPVFAGYLANLRATRARDGGVVLVDGGDMFQGTLESNLNEGAAVVALYGALGYDAVAIGNHEFDFGPAGERATPGPGDDPRGAIKARAAEAGYPFLAANLIDEATQRPVAWANVAPSTVVERAGVKVGVIGVTTIETPKTTIATNVVGLRVAPLAPAIAAEAARLRAAGAAVVVVAAHAGGDCKAFDRPADPSSCDPREEIVELAADLPRGLVDVIVGGHTHAGVAHELSGVAAIESYAKGVAFGRVDLVVEGGRVTSRTIQPPTRMCDPAAPDGAACAYEGAAVVPDPKVAAMVAEYGAVAAKRRDEPLGVTIAKRVDRAYGVESALGNLFTDLMLAARPDADLAIANGGSLRADLPKGPLTYGVLYEAMPFDNRFARVELTGAALVDVIAANLRGTGGILSIAGATVSARCAGGKLEVTVERGGKPLRPDDRISIATSDFLAAGGDGAFGKAAAPGSITIEDAGPTIRDEMARVLRARGGELRGDQLRDKARPRMRLPGDRPIRCGGKDAAPP